MTQAGDNKTVLKLQSQNNVNQDAPGFFSRIALKALKLLVLVILKVFYGFKAYNTEVLKTPGPVLLISNHLSWIDWLLIGVLLDDDWRFVTSKTTAQLSPLHKFIMVNRRTFPIDPLSPYSVKKIAEFLRSGGRLVLFAEGRMSRTGSLMKLYEGTGFLLHTTKAKLVLCRLQGVERTIWAVHSGWKKLFSPITLFFTDVINHPEFTGARTSIIRSKLTEWLREKLVEHQFSTALETNGNTVLEAIERSSRAIPGFVVLEDAQGNKLNYRRLSVGVNLLARQFLGVKCNENMRIGVLLPNISATAITLIALWKIGKVPAILNFSSGMSTMIKCSKLANFNSIVTSRAFVARARIPVEEFQKENIQIVYLEDIREKITLSDKLFEILKSYIIGIRLSSKDATNPDSTAVVLFTSGSETEPKGVELTHRNLLANIYQMLSVIDFQDNDRMFSCLPLFHSFGLTVGLLLPLVRGLYTYLYLSPLHYRLVPLLFYERECTILFSTNTFLNGYIRRANPYDFHNLKYLFAGAEKVQPQTADILARKFGVRVLEGYGATECSPVISVNTPLSNKFGTAGRFLPGIKWKLEPVEGIDEPGAGRLFVSGPNVMRGYINAEENKKFKSLGGWYDTGDIVKVDEDGFVHILGRAKRFAKISGEMISLTSIEEAISSELARFDQKLEVAILTKPDVARGESIVAVSNNRNLKLEDICNILRAKGFPNIAFPRILRVVKELPKLGTGKIDYRRLKDVILDDDTNR